MSFAFSCSSQLNAPVESVWEFVSTMQGVNFELMPLAKMTYPQSMTNLGDAPLGCRAFRSLILFLGWIPFDVHDLTLIRFEPGKGFYEKSSSLLHQYWIHDRNLVAQEQHSIITDRVEFLPKIAVFGHIMLPMFQLIFKNRHRKLIQKFGGYSL